MRQYAAEVAEVAEIRVMTTVKLVPSWSAMRIALGAGADLSHDRHGARSGAAH